MLNAAWLASPDAVAAASMDGEVLLAIREQPGFRDLHRPWLMTWQVREGDNAVLSRALHDIGRFLAGMFALQLHFSPGGLTLTKLAQALQLSKISSLGRARSSLIYLRFIGYIEPVSGGDGRTRVYRPTSQLLVNFKARMQRELIACWPADPAIRDLVPHFDQDDVFGAFVVALGGITALALNGYRNNGPTLDVISQRFGGLAVLSELLLSGDDSGPPDFTTPRAISVSNLSRNCGISRAQVRLILIAAEKSGFISTLPDGRYQLAPLLGEHLDLLLAGTLLLLAFAARQALDQTGVGAMAAENAADPKGVEPVGA